MNHRTGLIVLAAAALGALPAPADDKDKKVDESSTAVTATLAGKLHVHPPVPLAGPFPALLRTAKVGDKVLLQIAHNPQGSVVPRKVTVRSDTPAIGVLEILTTEHPLFKLKPGEKAEGTPGTHFAVLLKANASGNGNVVVTCEMSDGSEKNVPFQFRIEKGS